MRTCLQHEASEPTAQQLEMDERGLGDERVQEEQQRAVALRQAGVVCVFVQSMVRVLLVVLLISSCCCSPRIASSCSLPSCAVPVCCSAQLCALSVFSSSCPSSASSATSFRFVPRLLALTACHSASVSSLPASKLVCSAANDTSTGRAASSCSFHTSSVAVMCRLMRVRWRSEANDVRPRTGWRSAVC